MYKYVSFGGLALPRTWVGQNPNTIGTAAVVDTLQNIVGGVFDSHDNGSLSGTAYTIARRPTPQTINYAPMFLGEMPRRMRDEYHALTALVGRTGKLVRVDDLGNEQWLWATLMSITPAPKGGAFHQELRFVWQAPNPIWRGEYVTVTAALTGDNTTTDTIAITYDAPAPAQGIEMFVSEADASARLYRLHLWSTGVPTLSLHWLNETTYTIGSTGLGVLANDTRTIPSIAYFDLQTAAPDGTEHGTAQLLEIHADRTLKVQSHGYIGGIGTTTLASTLTMNYYKGYW